LPRNRRRPPPDYQRQPAQQVPRRVRDPSNFALRQFYALVAGILAGTGTGVGAFGVAYMSGAPAAVIIGSGLAVGVGAGALTLMLLHDAAVKLNVRDHPGGVSVAGDDAGIQLLAELARLAATLGVEFRIFRERNNGGILYDDEVQRARRELLTTFRPLTWPQLNDIS
jgi:hypothetical protein